MKRFRILRRLGKSKSSDVFLVETDNIEKKYALKKIETDKVADFDVFSYLIEKNISNVPQIYEQYCMMSYYYIFEEYIRGKTLEQIIISAKNTKAETLIKWMMDVCIGLKNLHNLKPDFIVHGDVNPRNIIIGETNVATLIDFGASHLIRAVKPLREKAKSLHIFSTQGFTAPEVYENKEISIKIDIYGIGKTLEFAISNLKENLKISEIQTDKINKIINTCTEENPDNRYDSINELLIELEQFC